MSEPSSACALTVSAVGPKLGRLRERRPQQCHSRPFMVVRELCLRLKRDRVQDARHVGLIARDRLYRASVLKCLFERSLVDARRHRALVERGLFVGIRRDRNRLLEERHSLSIRVEGEGSFGRGAE